MSLISLSSFTSKTSVLSLSLLYLDLFSLCTYSLSCKNYYPTISFLGTFRVHDLVVLLSLCLFSISLLPIFTSIHIKTSSVLTLDDSIFLLLLEIGIFILTITVGIIDESNGIEFNLIDNLHVFLSFCLSSVSVLYIYSVLNYLSQVKLTVSESQSLKLCNLWFKAGFVLLLFTIVQWHFAHTDLNGWVFNTYLETISEWALVTLTMTFPVQLSKVLDHSIAVIRQDKLD
jgi:hypothetical protein